MIDIEFLIGIIKKVRMQFSDRKNEFLCLKRTEFICRFIIPADFFSIAWKLTLKKVILISLYIS